MTARRTTKSHEHEQGRFTPYYHDLGGWPLTPSSCGTCDTYPPQFLASGAPHVFQYPYLQNTTQAFDTTAAPSHTPQGPSTVATPAPSCQQRRTRRNLPAKTTDYLKAWLQLHSDNPYPSEEEKRHLSHVTGLSISQVSNWMINARRRILAPSRKASATEASTPSESGSSNSGISPTARDLPDVPFLQDIFSDTQYDRHTEAQPYHMSYLFDTSVPLSRAGANRDGGDLAPLGYTMGF